MLDNVDIMGTLQQRQLHKSSLKRAILDSALQIIEKEGYHEVTIRKIAKAIDYSIPTIYEFFENKEMLLKELKKEWLQKMLQFIQRVGTRKPIEALKKIALAYAKYALENGAHYQAAMENTNGDFVEIDVLRTLLKELIQAATDRSKLDDKVDMFRSYLHGVVSLALTKKISGGKSRCYVVVEEGVSGLIKTWKK